jgi:hypothetical protein
MFWSPSPALLAELVLFQRGFQNSTAIRPLRSFDQLTKLIANFFAIGLKAQMPVGK